jgi:hypothetical protein
MKIITSLFTGVFQALLLSDGIKSHNEKEILFAGILIFLYGVHLIGSYFELDRSEING